MNAFAMKFYQQHGVKEIAPAFERQSVDGATIMFTRHCIRYSLGGCPKHQQRNVALKEPLFLKSMDGKRFKLTFDCQHCQMKVSLLKEGEK
jgi:putative protease